MPTPPPTYPMNGLLLDEESIYRAMDTKGTGEFVPLSFSAKTGKPLNAKSTLADTAKLGRIRDHLDGLLIDMAKNLYSGRIDAEPLCTGGRSPAPTVSSAAPAPTATVSTRERSTSRMTRLRNENAFPRRGSLFI